MSFDNGNNSCDCLSAFTIAKSKTCVSCLNSVHELEWKWDENSECPGISVSGNGRNVTFNSFYSSGTAAARGNLLMERNRHYFWEIRVYSKLYGTDIMIGIATPNFALNKFSTKFESLLGSDSESWGFSYNGKLHHGGQSWNYNRGFQHGDVIGVHLDTWSGTLGFYRNKQPLGPAFRGLCNYPSLYPVVCSTAAQVSMGLSIASSVPSSLFTLCLRAMAKHPHLIEWVATVPGMKNIRHHEWLFQLKNKNSVYEDDEDEDDFGLINHFSGKGLDRARDYITRMYHRRKRMFSRDDGLTPDSILNEALAWKGVWGEFTEELQATSQGTLTGNVESKGIYSNLMSSDEEDDNIPNECLFDCDEADKIRFVNSFASELCEVCKLKPAVSVRKRLNKCLRCVFLDKK